MLRFVRDISLRHKLTLAFLPIVLGGTAVSIVIGSQIITRALLAEAQKRVSTGLEAASMIYDQHMDRVRLSVVRSSQSEMLIREVQGAGLLPLPTVLASLREENGLDFLGFVDSNGNLVTFSGAKAQLPESDPIAELTRSARSGQAVSFTTVLDPRTLAREARPLATQARIPLVIVPLSRPHPEAQVESGLVLFSAAPVRVGHRTIGAAYGGVLLNRSTQVVDHIKRAVFGSEVFGGKHVGTVSIFLDDVRVSTHEKAEGTPVSTEVAERVLESGERWLGRAFVVENWFMTAYGPLRDQRGRIIGMLGLGVREDSYLALRTRVMLTFAVVAAIGVIIVLFLAYLIARAMIRPLGAMAVATGRIAAGDLDHKVSVTSGDEIGMLAASFNAMVGSLKVARDELRQWTDTLEDKVKERTEELVRMQSKMAEAEKLASLGRMAAGVAHEINNPMGGVLTFASLGLQDLSPDHPQRRNFEIIIKQTMRCRDIVKGLLEFSRQSESKPTPTDLDDVVDKTLVLLQQQASFQNVKVIRIAEEELPRVLIDPDHAQQVVLNLVVNAVDAMEEKGELEVATRAAPDSAEVLLEVHDTGKGIPGEILPLIFEPFFTTKEVGRGTGLGLAIVHGIVTRAGGQVQVKTSPLGTTFTVRLPVAPDGGDSAVRPPVSPS